LEEGWTRTLAGRDYRAIRCGLFLLQNGRAFDGAYDFPRKTHTPYPRAIEETLGSAWNTTGEPTVSARKEIEG